MQCYLVIATEPLRNCYETVKIMILFAACFIEIFGQIFIEYDAEYNEE